MPRKASIKGRGRQRPQTAAPSDDDTDVNMSVCSTDGKEERLAIFLKDFEMQVEQRVHQAESEITAMLSQFRNMMSIELFKIPKEIRKMKRSEFLAKSGNIETLTFDDVSDAMLGVDSSNLNDPLGDVTNTQGKANSTAGRKKNVRAGKAANAKGTRIGKARPIETEEFSTPYTGANAPAAHSTPMITPKFDMSRFPVHVARDGRPGETLVSLAGSPVVIAQDNESNVTRSVGDFLDDGSPSTQQRNLLKLKALVDSKLRELKR